MCFKIILKVTKNLGLTLCLEDPFFEKPQGGQINTPAVLRLSNQNEEDLVYLFKSSILKTQVIFPMVTAKILFPIKSTKNNIKIKVTHIEL